MLTALIKLIIPNIIVNTFSDFLTVFLILGTSKQDNLLVVCHCYRVSDTVVRIISAKKQQKVKRICITIEGDLMRAEYDFSKGIKNPYIRKTKKQITINLDIDTINYFKSQAKETGIPYQTLINLFLSDCATQRKQLQTTWH